MALNYASVLDWGNKPVNGVWFRTDEIDNKGVPLKISWAVTLDALSNWNHAHGISNLAEITNFLLDQVIKDKISIFLKTIKQFIDRFNGYPSDKIKINVAYCIFCFTNGKIEQSMSLSHNMNYFYLFIDIFGVKHHLLSPSYIIKHELYHGVSRARENEKKLLAMMNDYSRKEEHVLKNNFATIEKSVKLIEKYVSNGGAVWKETHEAIKYLLKEESELMFLCKHKFGVVQLLENMIGDSFLTIIAMEINDEDYVKEAVNGDEHNLNNLRKQIKHISQLRKVVLSEKQISPAIAKTYYETQEIALALIELLLFFRYLPIKGTPVLSVGAKFRNAKMNPFYSSKYARQAHKNKLDYLDEAKSCAEHNFIAWFFEAYAGLLMYKLLDINQPFQELHKNFKDYEKLGNRLKERITFYLSALEKNIKTLETKNVKF